MTRSEVEDQQEVYEKAMEIYGVLCKQKTNKPHSHVLNANFWTSWKYKNDDDQ